MSEKNNFEKLIDDTINFSYGLFHFSKEKVKLVVDEMVERGEIQKNKAEDAVNELIKKGEKERKEIKNLAKETIDEQIDLSEYVKKSELDFYIEKKVEEILKERNK